MELQTLGDRALRKLAFSHVVHSIKRMNQKHKNEAQNRALQNILFPMLQQEDEAQAKRSLITLCDLHRRKVWFDDRTANAVCTACFHSSSRIMIAALSFLLDYEKIEDDDDSDGSSSEDETPQKPQVVLSKGDVYKAHHKGTLASKKKKKAKLQRVIRNMKRKQRLSSEKGISNNYSPLNHLKDAQGFSEKLFSRLQTCNERFEVKMMMLKVIARTVGLHRLILLNFYPFLQKYVQPHQRDVTNLLAAAVQACHDMVPPDAVEPLFKQIVNQFVHDRSRTEAIAVGLNVVREICLRIPLLMTEDLLQDLVLYKKSHEKAVSTAARSLITLFREICPSLLIKKDRGRPTDPKAKPKAFGEVNVVSSVPGAELLQHDDDDDDDVNDDNSDETGFSDCDDSHDSDVKFAASDGEQNELDNHNSDLFRKDSTNDVQVAEVAEDEDGNNITDDDSVDVSDDDDDDDDNESGGSGDEDDDEDYDDDDGVSDDVDGEEEEGEKEFNDSHKTNDHDDGNDGTGEEKSKARKRKALDFEGQLNAADTSLRALKRLAGAKMGHTPLDSTDGILSNEDFQRIKDLKAKEEAKFALAQHGLLRKGSDAKSTGFKIPTSDQLSVKRVDPAMLEVNIRKKLSKEERLELVRAGREDRGKYQARAAVKQKKTGGLSNRQKEHKKAMPLAAKRSKIQKSREVKRKQQRRSGKQFRGRKAWK